MKQTRLESPSKRVKLSSMLPTSTIAILEENTGTEDTTKESSKLPCARPRHGRCMGMTSTYWKLSIDGSLPVAAVMSGHPAEAQVNIPAD